MYKFYATILDAFQYYLHSDSDTAMQEFLDKINRKPFESEAADMGTAFNEVVDAYIKNPGSMPHLNNGEEFVTFHFESRAGRAYDFGFKTKIVSEFVSRLNLAIPQVYTEATLQTSKGEVLLYGYIDEVLGSDVTDIKTTGNYNFPKFLHGWQHRVYPYCLSKQGITAETFTYRITDFNNYFEEVYQVNNEKAERELIEVCERLIDFLELNKHLITDTKIFGGQ